ncbi:hypothetical protein TREAZ_0374 [Leadbettera azotonutricia ZAS-9]|uniref:Uncharacterized protein n=1 Tax=Leadbettera azotonutricia (strain ATCC BAA-888 / DSM 13862 / ZAS-9) TaxID=545695 RepID=F5YCZ8_LEAAZ|nr:hypothetical protein TREAZ_0374 [Leadbettera azotonutricia ZAS-9]
MSKFWHGFGIAFQIFTLVNNLIYYFVISMKIHNQNFSRFQFLSFLIKLYLEK